MSSSAFGDFIAFGSAAAPSSDSAKNNNNTNNHKKDANRSSLRQSKNQIDGISLTSSSSSDDSDDGDVEANNNAPKIIIKSLSSYRRPYQQQQQQQQNEDAAEGRSSTSSNVSDDDNEREHDDFNEEENNNRNDEDDHDDALPETNQNNKKQQSGKKNHKTSSSTAPIEYTEQFKDVVCDVFRGPDAPVHAMFHLTQPITVRGPCAVIGLCGQCTVQGYFLRQRSVIIPDFSSSNNNNNNTGGGGAHVAIQPIPASCRKTVVTELVKGWSSSSSSTTTTPNDDDGNGFGSGAVAILQHLALGVPINRSDPSIRDDLDTIEEIETTFGKINWSWTRQVLESWKQRFGRSSDLTVVLVIAESHLQQQIGIAPQQKSNNNNNNTSGGGKKQSSAPANDFARLPFFAPRMAAVPHVKLLHSLLPELVTSPTRKMQQEKSSAASSSSTSSSAAPPSVLIAGTVNTGKSTTARYLCNVLLSLYGACLWLDLDLGQSEFAPPGGIGLFKVTEPLVSSNQYRGVENILTHYLGSTTMRDPVATANAIESICNKVLQMQKRQKLDSSNSNINTNGVRRPRQQQQEEDDQDLEENKIHNSNNNNSSKPRNNNNNTNVKNQQRRQQNSSSSGIPLPVIINTHGWVLSTGRRATVEVLQRLCPTQIVHLFTPTCTDKHWLLPSGGIIHDPTCGLNSKVFDDSKFSSSSSSSLIINNCCSNTTSNNNNGFPNATTRQWAYTIHRYTHERVFDKDATDNRAKAWTRYFWNSQAPMNENRSTAVSLMTSSFPADRNSSSASSLKLKTERITNFFEENPTTSSLSSSIPTLIHSRPGKVISLPFNKVRLIFAEEEQMPWQFRGRISRLFAPPPSTSSVVGNNNNNNNNKMMMTSLTPAIKAEILDSISGSLVGLGTTTTTTATMTAKKENNNNADSTSTFLEISQLNCESSPPNIFGYGIILCSADADSAADKFSSVKVVVPSSIADLVMTNSSGEIDVVINLVIGYQQFDANWNQDMAKVALRGGII